MKRFASRPRISGVSTAVCANYALRWATINGHTKIIKYLLTLPHVNQYSIGCCFEIQSRNKMMKKLACAAKI